MDVRRETREFLTSRRAKISPEQAGLSWYSDRRRVPGLRREEVATLAGVSVDYYTRLERGNLSGVSDTVLESLARALQLDQAERGHLFDLARASQAGPTPRRRNPSQRVRPSVERMLEVITSPALIRNGRLDILAANPLGRALYSDQFATPARPVNSARFVFLDPRAGSFYNDWNAAADDIVAILRSEAGRNPHDKALTDLVGELSIHSEHFRKRWATHNVRFHLTGQKRFHHSVVGDLVLDFERMDLAADNGLTLYIYTAPVGSKTDDALNLLASWTATEDWPDTAPQARSARPPELEA